MSQENVEVLRAWIEAFNRREHDVIAELHDSAIEWQTSAEDPDATIHRGQEGGGRPRVRGVRVHPGQRRRYPVGVRQPLESPHVPQRAGAEVRRDGHPAEHARVQARHR